MTQEPTPEDKTWREELAMLLRDWSTPHTIVAIAIIVGLLLWFLTTYSWTCTTNYGRTECGFAQRTFLR